MQSIIISAEEDKTRKVKKEKSKFTGKIGSSGDPVFDSYMNEIFGLK